TDPLIKRMAERGTGAVVNVVGMGGKVATTTHLAGGAANAALMLASAGLAAAYGPRGVRVNAVNPTVTLTDRMAQGLAADARLRNISTDEALRQAQARMPLGRLALPEDIANAVVFLASPRAGYISGAVLSMDGAATPMVVRGWRCCHPGLEEPAPDLIRGDPRYEHWYATMDCGSGPQ